MNQREIQSHRQIFICYVTFHALSVGAKKRRKKVVEQDRKREILVFFTSPFVNALSPSCLNVTSECSLLTLVV